MDLGVDILIANVIASLKNSGIQVDYDTFTAEGLIKTVTFSNLSKNLSEYNNFIATCFVPATLDASSTNLNNGTYTSYDMYCKWGTDKTWVSRFNTDNTQLLIKDSVESLMGDNTDISIVEKSLVARNGANIKYYVNSSFVTVYTDFYMNVVTKWNNSFSYPSSTTWIVLAWMNN